MKMGSDGKFKFKNDAAELVATLSDLVDTLVNAQTITLIGPQPFIPPTILKLEALKLKLDALKGT
jgi:hypothetical protein